MSCPRRALLTRPGPWPNLPTPERGRARPMRRVGPQLSRCPQSCTAPRFAPPPDWEFKPRARPASGIKILRDFGECVAEPNAPCIFTLAEHWYSEPEADG